MELAVGKGADAFEGVLGGEEVPGELEVEVLRRGSEVSREEVPADSQCVRPVVPRAFRCSWMGRRSLLSSGCVRR